MHAGSAGTFRVAGNQLSGTVPPELTTSFPVNSTTWASNCIVNASTPRAGCDLPERDSLIDFYMSMGGPFWVTGNAWMAAPHPCAWIGVTCLGGSATSGPVVDITFLSSFIGLSGSLPSTLSQLTALTYEALLEDPLLWWVPGSSDDKLLVRLIPAEGCILRAGTSSAGPSRHYCRF